MVYWYQKGGDAVDEIIKVLTVAWLIVQIFSKIYELVDKANRENRRGR
jgi:hypothetical protein